MKRILLIIILFAGITPVHPQFDDDHEIEAVSGFKRSETSLGSYIGVGYGMMFPSGKGIKDFVAAYNGQRALILSKELSTAPMGGMHYNIGLMIDGIVFDFGYASRSGTMSVEADRVKVSPGEAVKRDIKLKSSALTLSAGYLYGKIPVVIGPYLDISFNSLDFETSTNTSSEKSYELDSHIGLNTGLMVSFMPIKDHQPVMILKAYYSFDLSEPHWRELYIQTGTTSPSATSIGSIKGGFGGFGISLTVNFFVGCI